MRAGAELGRRANASFDWPPLKERTRHRDAGLVGFLNSKPSWKRNIFEELINDQHFKKHFTALNRLNFTENAQENQTFPKILQLR